jgi:hypothetical protein
MHQVIGNGFSRFANERQRHQQSLALQYAGRESFALDTTDLLTPSSALCIAIPLARMRTLGTKMIRWGALPESASCYCTLLLRHRDILPPLAAQRMASASTATRCAGWNI